MIRRSLIIAFRFLAVSAAIVVSFGPAHSQTTLKAAMHSDLKIVDPIWTTALISQHHGYMIYDTLFALDEKLAIKPQMVEAHAVSADNLTWTFTLRDGLAWHDGTPVTAADCVASINRWGKRDSMGQKLAGYIASLEPTDTKTITMKLKEPYGLVLQSLAKPGSNVPFMMPKRVADTDASTQISDFTGSGPFVFKGDEWKPGSKVVYLKNSKYKPRSEPSSGLAGAKIAKVDRVEWIWIADPQTQINALLNGEVDFVEAPPHDLFPLLAKDKNVSLEIYTPPGRQYALRFNVLHKPFDNAKVRQAVVHALSQKDFLDATIGDAKWYTECKSLFPCGSPLESTKGWGDALGANPAKAKQLLAEAGYDGTPIVIMQSTDIASLANLAPVAKAQLEKVGFKVEVQPMDWQTLVARRTKKDPPAAGGWHAFLTSWGSVDILDPVAMSFLNASCENATFGWPCDAEIERLRDAYARETDAGKQRQIAEAIQLRAIEYPTHVPLGQYSNPVAVRKGVSGIVVGGALAIWGIEKN